VAFGLAYDRERLAEAGRWLDVARACRARETSDDRADAHALIASSQGHADQSLALRDRQVALVERIYGGSHPRVAAATNNRGPDFAANGQNSQRNLHATPGMERRAARADEWLAHDGRAPR
jgi:hypothetical protein